MCEERQDEKAVGAARGHEVVGYGSVDGRAVSCC